MRRIIALAMAACLGGAVEAQNYRNQDSRTSQPNRSTQREVQHFNRASNLIGAEVRTRDAEKVGEVKDVVIDFQTGRVAYIVVDASEVLEGENTNVAIPAGAFRATRGQDHVTLEADTDRLRNIRSFSQNDLPAIRTPGLGGPRMGMGSGMGMGPGMGMGRGMGQEMRRWQEDRPMNRWQQQPSRGDYDRQYDDRYREDYSRQQERRQYRQSRPDPYQDRSRSEYQSGSQQQYQSSTSDDPSLYLYEWYIYDLSPDEEEYSGRQDQEDAYGRYGSSQYGEDRSSGRDRSQQFDDRNRQDDRYQNQDRRYNQQDYEQQQSRTQSRDQQFLYDRDYDYDFERRSNTGQGRSSSSQSGQSEQRSSQSSDSNRASDNGQQGQTFSGWIRDLDQQNRIITVEGPNGTKSFKISENPTVKMSGQANASLGELERGNWVEVGYRYEDGNNQAFSINETPRRDSRRE